MQTTARKLRASKACFHCRAAKRRCDTKSPCNRCLARGLDCYVSGSPSFQTGAHGLGEGEAANEDVAIILDLPPAANSTGRYFIERYFEDIASYWPVVQREDLAVRPFVPPLLSRSICLLVASYLSHDQENDPVVSDLLESVKQIFDSFRVVAMPSLWCLQSLLLLIACPGLPRQSTLVTAAGRMALTLGLGRKQNPRNLLFWSALLAGQWESLLDTAGRCTRRPCPDLRSVAPHIKPDPSTLFGMLCAMISQADEARRNGLQLMGWNPENLQSLAPGKSDEEIEEFRQLLRVTAFFLNGEPGSENLQASIEKATKCRAANLNPFNAILKRLRDRS